MEGARSTSPTVDNVFVSFSTPRSLQEATQPSRPTRPQLIQLLSDSPNNYEIAASLNELEHEISFLPSGLLTPTSPNDVNKQNFPMDCSSSCLVSPSKKKLCVEGDDETPLYQKLQRLSKSELIDILSTLVYKKHPELREVSVFMKYLRVFGLVSLLIDVAFLNGHCVVRSPKHYSQSLQFSLISFKGGHKPYANTKFARYGGKAKEVKKKYL